MSQAFARRKLPSAASQAGLGGSRVLPGGSQYGCQDLDFSLVARGVPGGCIGAGGSGFLGFRDTFPRLTHMCVSLYSNWYRETRKARNPEAAPVTLSGVRVLELGPRWNDQGCLPIRRRVALEPAGPARARRSLAGAAPGRAPSAGVRRFDLSKLRPLRTGAGGSAHSAVVAGAGRGPARARRSLAGAASRAEVPAARPPACGSSLGLDVCGCQDRNPCVGSGRGNGFTPGVPL